MMLVELLYCISNAKLTSRDIIWLRSEVSDLIIGGRERKRSGGFHGIGAKWVNVSLRGTAVHAVGWARLELNGVRETRSRGRRGRNSGRLGGESFFRPGQVGKNLRRIRSPTQIPPSTRYSCKAATYKHHGT